MKESEFTDEVVEKIKNDLLSLDIDFFQEMYFEQQEEGKYLLIGVVLNKRLSEDEIFPHYCEILDDIIYKWVNKENKDINWSCGFRYKGELIESCVSVN